MVAKQLSLRPPLPSSVYPNRPVGNLTVIIISLITLTYEEEIHAALIHVRATWTVSSIGR